jgi:hypothetical protein
MTRSSMARQASTDRGSLKSKSSTTMGDDSRRLCSRSPVRGTRPAWHQPGGSVRDRMGHDVMASM